MSLDSYSTIIIISLLFHLVNIIYSLILLKDSEFKGGFILIIIGLITISVIQFNDFISIDYLRTETIILSPLELISFIGSILLFLILTAFIITLKFTSQKPPTNTYFYKPVNNFHHINTSEERNKSSYEAPPSKETREQRDTFSKPEKKKIYETPEPKAGQKLSNQSVKTVEEKTHVKEIPSNGKAIVAKFIPREEPRNEADRLKDELEKIKFQRDKLVSIISHDLRTPLNSVFGYCQLLKEGQYKNRNEVKQFAENIFELSRQQLNALNKIVEWTKYESSNIQLNPADFDVTSTINFVAKSMSKIAEEKNIKIIVNSKPELYVHGDEFMIIEVLKNLLDNAIKFSHPNSSIEIHSHYHEKLNKLVVLVVDSGVGIDREILMNLLISTKKFTTRGTKGEKGLGLGLLIVKAILDKHGENLWIASEEGKWTRVYFTLKPAESHSG